MRRILVRCAAVCAALALVAAVAAHGHFGMVIPSSDVVEAGDDRQVALDLLFAHPFEGTVMNMEKPAIFGVLVRGRERSDLQGTLVRAEAKAAKAWKTSYKIDRPGDHVFFVEPVPYWEEAEGKYIVHYAKVVVNSMGLEEGWDAEVGLRTEIIPLSRPYGLYTGNLFRGIVRVDGKPSPYAVVEVEYYNRDGAVKAPSGAFATQVVKADSNGVFAYAMPKAGWWGFAALSDDTRNIVRDGKACPVEIGAVMWVRCVDMK